MKRHGILNGEISSVLSFMGHTDRIAVSDCGLPVPEGTRRIDLALKEGLPSFIQVLEAVTDDMKIEKIVLAEEIKTQNPHIHEKILQLVSGFETQCEIEYVSHSELKKQTKECRAVIRSGEATPYANVILQSACLF